MDKYWEIFEEAFDLIEADCGIEIVGALKHCAEINGINCSDEMADFISWAHDVINDKI
tara:strand:+ start:1555 stop:1728 length:174 start_codon:yes stop_codon:yes gene_type:complete